MVSSWQSSTTKKTLCTFAPVEEPQLIFKFHEKHKLLTPWIQRIIRVDANVLIVVSFHPSPCAFFLLSFFGWANAVAFYYYAYYWCDLLRNEQQAGWKAPAATQKHKKRWLKVTHKNNSPSFKVSHCLLYHVRSRIALQLQAGYTN